MPSEHPLYPRFPSQIIPEGAHTPQWMPLRASSTGSDARIRRQSRPYWVSDLSECILTRTLKNTVFAMLYRQCGTRPVLNHVPPFCEIGIEEDDSDPMDGEPLVSPQFLGTVGGGNHTVYLRKRLLIDGYEDEELYYDVRYPHVDFPPLKGLGRTLAGTVGYEPMPELTLYHENSILPRAYWTPDRDAGTGLVTISNGISGDIYATGGFYIKMLLPNSIPTTYVGNGNFKIKSGIHLEEPPGGN